MFMGKELHKRDSGKAYSKCWTAGDESQSCSMMLSKEAKKWKPQFPTSSLCVTFYPMNYDTKLIRVSSWVKTVQTTEKQIGPSAFSRKISLTQQQTEITLFLLAVSVPETLLLAKERAKDTDPLPEPLLLLHNAHLAPSVGVVGWAVWPGRRAAPVGSCNCSVHTPWGLCSHWLRIMDKTPDVSGTSI